MPDYDPALSTPEAGEELDVLMPLYFFVGAMSPLEVSFIPGEEMPEPERGLLVHQSDMTPTLRAFHESEIDLEVRSLKESDDYVMRAVVLRRRDDKMPVEFGAIGIRLEAFEPPVREMIVAGEIPLGSILETEKIPHSSHPRAYFRITIDERLAEVLEAEVGGVHYGRSNQLSDEDGIVFADIVEVLPKA